jgi:hypothetical protein
MELAGPVVVVGILLLNKLFKFLPAESGFVFAGDTNSLGIRSKFALLKGAPSGVPSDWGGCNSLNMARTNSRHVGKRVFTPGKGSAFRLSPAPTMTAARDFGHCHRSFCTCLTCGRSGKCIH